jgi:riboflavin biosynthesis pyrimidine reductase
VLTRALAGCDGVLTVLVPFGGVDFAAFMVAALTDESLIHEAPAIVGCATPSALEHARGP